ncbi:GGDEF domain-containing protein [Leucobacter zeae]|nr:GGDEF domain-containing protein [Leucobacter zeae]
MQDADRPGNTPTPPLNGARSFTESAERVVEYLKRNTPLTDWSVSRVSGGEQVHLHVRHDQVLSVGDRVDWQESFCSRMSAGAAHVVRDARADADYADLDAAEQVGAYAGFTIGDDRDGEFGILCGVRPAPLRDDEQVDEPLVRMLSELLTTQLVLARAIDRERRRVELTEVLAHTDALTGVLNRRGWDGLIADAQERLDAFGDPVAVAVVDLDGLKRVNDSEGHAAGDRLIARAADALRRACAPGAHVARYGGDEFTILANGISPAQSEAAAAEFARALDRAGVRASIGVAAAEPGIVPLDAALELADRRMYAHKLARRAG